MTKASLLLLVLPILLATRSSAESVTYTNLIATYSDLTNGRPTVTIQSNQFAKVVYVKSQYSGGSNPTVPTYSLYISVGNSTFTYDLTSIAGATNATSTLGLPPSANLPCVAGPAEIQLRFLGQTNDKGIATIQIVNTDQSFVPSGAVVIPADSGGPVNIILESSTDLITWTPALSGTYGTSTTNRFFRVRAQRAQ